MMADQNLDDVLRYLDKHHDTYLDLNEVLRLLKIQADYNLSIAKTLLFHNHIEVNPDDEHVIRISKAGHDFINTSNYVDNPQLQRHYVVSPGTGRVIAASVEEPINPPTDVSKQLQSVLDRLDELTLKVAEGNKPNVAIFGNQGNVAYQCAFDKMEYNLPKTKTATKTAKKTAIKIIISIIGSAAAGIITWYVVKWLE
jgi:hypothetical protein